MIKYSFIYLYISWISLSIFSILHTSFNFSFNSKSEHHANPHPAEISLGTVIKRPFTFYNCYLTIYSRSSCCLIFFCKVRNNKKSQNKSYYFQPEILDYCSCVKLHYSSILYNIIFTRTKILKRILLFL